MGITANFMAISGDDLQLYDPQLGLPLRNKGGGVATLAEVAAEERKDV